MSGTLGEAGGIGGLLAVSLQTGQQAQLSYYCDVKGDIRQVVNAESGGVEVYYEYGPFGEALRATEMSIVSSSFGFSSKYTDKTGMLYYGYRYYSPVTGR